MMMRMPQPILDATVECFTTLQTARDDIAQRCEAFQGALNLAHMSYTSDPTDEFAHQRFVAISHMTLTHMLALDNVVATLGTLFN